MCGKKHVTTKPSHIRSTLDEVSTQHDTLDVSNTWHTHDHDDHDHGDGVDLAVEGNPSASDLNNGSLGVSEQEKKLQISVFVWQSHIADWTSHQTHRLQFCHDDYGSCRPECGSTTLFSRTQDDLIQTHWNQSQVKRQTSYLFEIAMSDPRKDYKAKAMDFKQP